ncbi:MAG: succinate dehydrogenase cytochrome b subunit [Acidimicrobiia bacterium]
MTTTKRPPVKERTRWQHWLGGFFSSSIGLKWIMAITGIGLLGYVAAHLFGNLKIFTGTNEAGEYYIDLYSEALWHLGGHLLPQGFLLTLLRIGLAAVFVLHIWAAVVLTKRNREATGATRYRASRQWAASNYASRTMRFGGVIIALFVLYHLADLTFGIANPDFHHGDVYNNMVASLSRWPVAVLYMVANIALAFHIYHGAWSLFQSLGTVNPRYDSFRRAFAWVFAAVILVGNLSMPVAILAGWVS